MEAIKITVTGTQAHLIDAPTLTAGTVGQPVEFVFDEAWEELRKTAVFRAGGMTKDMVDINTECTVPWEVMEKTGCCLHIGVYGTNADGTKVIPTVWAKLDPILPGADPSGDESTDPTLPVWEQISKAAVKTVNGVAPDKNGNVEVLGGNGTGTVKSVNGHTPDAQGNVELPELGDISTALDSIIAMQEELIGV